ncbi:MAG: hypothetical protein HF978_09275 [Desulfobacteraceae bacterium]|nr:hypothetical protein [Desulfobacteraceae bacterium]MBC2755726.1 hypothetical protein [Desulfobacteraceae bacterium]
MTVNVFYLNLIKFFIMAFVLAFIAYVANATEVMMDLEPFPACTSCLAENSDSNNPNKITKSFFAAKLITQKSDRLFYELCISRRQKEHSSLPYPLSLRLAASPLNWPCLSLLVPNPDPA